MLLTLSMYFFTAFENVCSSIFPLITFYYRRCFARVSHMRATVVGGGQLRQFREFAFGGHEAHAWRDSSFKIGRFAPTK